MASPFSGQTTGHPTAWGRSIDPYYWTDEIHPTGVTSAGAWTPTGAVAAPDFAGLTGVLAAPATDWGASKITLQDGSQAHWTGTAWAKG